MYELNQYPPPGRHLLQYCGDTLEITLSCPQLIPESAKAFLSTNIGNAAIRRAEIIRHAEYRLTIGGQDWNNIPMQRMNEFTWRIRLALAEEGHFECKCCIICDDGVTIWAKGDNVHINVLPAAYASSNSVYCVFPRQFGSNMNLAKSKLPDGVTPKMLQLLDRNGYSVIPPSGTFRGVVRNLDHIIDDLKCRIIHLLPVNPTPTTYARMGRFGSPYASQDFTEVDPALAEFDVKATPLEQFYELVDAVHGKNARIFLDLAINHTGWASWLQTTKPNWFVRKDDRTYVSPGAWGVIWGDLVELNHNNRDLWKYLANVFLTWCKRGVDGFRCDAGYMIPAEAWEYIIAVVRNEYPETIFLLEGLGGDPAITRNLLDQANMNWAYSELFQNYTRQQIEGYLSYSWKESSSDGVMVHYAETHDNNRLASVSPRYSSMRTALSAFASSCGAFGFTNGVEWYATEKIDVHESNALNWGAKPNQISLIARLNTILALHPAFHNGAMIECIDSGAQQAVVIARSDIDNHQHALCVVNLDCNHPTVVTWDSSHVPFDGELLPDLISGTNASVLQQRDRKRSVTLQPGQFLCLVSDVSWLKKVEAALKSPELYQAQLAHQQAASMALRAIIAKHRSAVLPNDENVHDLAQLLLKAPERFIQELYKEQSEIPYVLWSWPTDLRREALLPPNHCILVVAPHRFRFSISDNTSGSVIALINSLTDSTGRCFALIPPLQTPKVHRQLKATIYIYANDRLDRSESTILQLAPDITHADVIIRRSNLYHHARVFLQSNGKGAIIHQCLEQSRLNSRYDAVMLANLHPNIPVDRHIMWRRNRMWVVYRARLQEVKDDHIDDFHLADDGGGVWNYRIPVGNGHFVSITMKMKIIEGVNAVRVTFHRNLAIPGSKLDIPDEASVRIIFRPDIEDRNFHTETKASGGPERDWPSKLHEDAKGFVFEPARGRALAMHASLGAFVRNEEWSYMIYQPNEAARGLDPNSDLYSPGYFRFSLTGDDYVSIVGQIMTSENEPRIPPTPEGKINSFRKADSQIDKIVLNSLRAFIVKRGDLKTVIAGYPWFLDWGRDTLIFVRGLISEPEFRADVRKILTQFAKLADHGTICNMIAGDDTGNRDTSDAQLWLFIGIRDLCEAEGSFDFLKTPVRENENLLQVLVSLAEGLIEGTPNGIKCDPESGLIFSPAHFTWMDTNYPAGTPREGYPIEIQALWHAALRFLASALPDNEAERWSALADQVKESFEKYFIRPDIPYLSDCLHGTSGTPASHAIADDHLRPNQLLAITLGLVTDKALCSRILIATSSLLTPGAIRSLADRPVKHPLPIIGRGGVPLNDPLHPYRGHYVGDEDTSRKVAYHNGTAWTWQFPLWPEAYYKVHKAFGRDTAASVLSAMTIQLDSGCLGQVPEILDGDAPHTPRGCDAQAWGLSEFYRVWKILHATEV